MNTYLTFIFRILLSMLIVGCGSTSFSDSKIQELNSMIKSKKFTKAEEHLRKNSGLDLNTLSEKEETMLELTIKENNLEGFKWLLKNGANPNLITKERLNSVMKLASEHENPEYLIQAILFKGDVNLSHRSGENPLYFATVLNKNKNVDILISNKADGLLEDKYNNNTFKCLIYTRNYKGFNYLVSKGLEPIKMSTKIIENIVFELESSSSNLLPESKEDFLKVVKYFNDHGVSVELLTFEEFNKKYKVNYPK